MVRTMIDEDRGGIADRSKEIWQLLTLEVWYRQQGGDRDEADRPELQIRRVGPARGPGPAMRPGGVLVRTEFSLISIGTETMKIHESKLSLIGKARARPDQVKKVVESVAQQGPLATYRKSATGSTLHAARLLAVRRGREVGAGVGGARGRAAGRLRRQQLRTPR